MLQRVGISLEDDLLAQFDRLIQKRGYTNRSEAIRDLIRDQLIQKEWTESTRTSMAIVVLVYDHHKSDLAQRLTDIQHDSYQLILSTQHFHVDHDNCLEVLALKGKTRKIQQLGEALISVRGVKHGKFIPTTTGQNLS